MSLSSIILKLRAHGIKGALNYLKRNLFGRDHAYRKYFLHNASRFPIPPQRGVTIVAHFSRNASFVVVMHDIIQALSEARIPYQVFDLDSPPPDDFRIMRYDHVIEIEGSIVPEINHIRKAVIAYWEFDTGLKEGYPFLYGNTPIIAMSDFNADYFRAALPATTPVHKLLYPMRKPAITHRRTSEIRRKYGIPDAFMVFFNFGLGSSRKNPEGCIKAFAKAFAKDGNATLVFKTAFSNRFPAHLASLKALAKSEGIENQFVTIDEWIPQEELYAVTDMCDVYVSLHRGEGFGLGIAEAMSLGKPVVVTGWSANTEFCNSDNSIIVPYTLRPVSLNPSDLPTYRGVKRWAEPDIEAAAKALRRLYDDRELGASIGRKGASFIHEHFTLEQFRKSINDFLNGKALPLPQGAP